MTGFPAAAPTPNIARAAVRVEKAVRPSAIGAVFVGVFLCLAGASSVARPRTDRPPMPTPEAAVRAKASAFEGIVIERWAEVDSKWDGAERLKAAD